MASNPIAFSIAALAESHRNPPPQRRKRRAQRTDKPSTTTATVKPESTPAAQPTSPRHARPHPA